jgi:hypothetical protein
LSAKGMIKEEIKQKYPTWVEEIIKENFLKHIEMRKANITPPFSCPFCSSLHEKYLKKKSTHQTNSMKERMKM